MCDSVRNELTERWLEMGGKMDSERVVVEFLDGLVRSNPIS